MTNQITYTATKTASDFHLNDSRVRLSIGPVGCGKSVKNCIEIFRRATEQEAGYDGIRRSRWAIIRNTYPELKATTIKTWQDWFPENYFGKINWGSPITHHIIVDDIDCEVIFLALDTHVDIKKLMSFELTGAYINEMQFIPKSIFDICKQRVNRYPSLKSGAKITWSGLIADTNPPDTDHWIYKHFEEKKPEEYSLFKYEPALVALSSLPPFGVKYAKSLDGTIYIKNENADYIKCQNDQNYWINLVSGYTDEQIKVYLLGQYGVFVDGRPVHPEFNDKLHCANNEIQYSKFLEIGLGWDFGLTPACSVVQLMPQGELNVLDELYSDDMSLRDFAEYVVIPALNLRYPEWRKKYVSRHDPAGQVGSQTDGKSCQAILADLGIESLPAADNNSPTARRDGLKYFLRRIVSGKVGYQLSTRCQRLRKALMGNYHYKRVRSSVEELYHDTPVKNSYSHIAEAHEYICMHYTKNYEKEEVDIDMFKDKAKTFWSR